jgi:hypothetical protein
MYSAQGGKTPMMTPAIALGGDILWPYGRLGASVVWHAVLSPLHLPCGIPCCVHSSFMDIRYQMAKTGRTGTSHCEFGAARWCANVVLGSPAVFRW